jgi:hypothetical protein
MDERRLAAVRGRVERGKGEPQTRAEQDRAWLLAQVDRLATDLEMCADQYAQLGGPLE